MGMNERNDAVWKEVNRLYDLFRDEPALVGFSVPGDCIEFIEDQIQIESRSPIRMRSGELIIWNGLPDLGPALALPTFGKFIRAREEEHGWSPTEPCFYGDGSETTGSCRSDSGGCMECIGGVDYGEGFKSRCLNGGPSRQQAEIVNRLRESAKKNTRESQVIREPIVKIYKDNGKGGNGAFAISTTATDADELLRECASELEIVTSRFEGDLDFTFQGLLPQICELWAKLRGYKADTVFERRMLIVGAPNPEAHMSYVNEPAAEKQTV